MAVSSMEVTNRDRWGHWINNLKSRITYDFLRIENDNEAPAIVSYPPDMFLNHSQMSQRHVQRLDITIAEAKLVRNYGFTRMDPYVRIQVGDCVYETQTDPNGGKNPRWNRVIQCLLALDVTTIYIKVFDECNFKMDELIAWTEIRIPESVLNDGQTHGEWYALNGKQGIGLEGAMHVILTVAPLYYYPVLPAANMMMVPPGRPTPIFLTPQQCIPDQQISRPQPLTPPQPISQEDLVQISDMFPTIEKTVIQSVYEANRGNKSATINSLLQISE